MLVVGEVLEGKDSLQAAVEVVPVLVGAECALDGFAGCARLEGSGERGSQERWKEE